MLLGIPGCLLILLSELSIAKPFTPRPRSIDTRDLNTPAPETNGSRGGGLTQALPVPTTTVHVTTKTPIAALQQPPSPPPVSQAPLAVDLASQLIPFSPFEAPVSPEALAPLQPTSTSVAPTQVRTSPLQTHNQASAMPHPSSPSPNEYADATALVIKRSLLPIPDSPAGNTAIIDGESYTVPSSRVIVHDTTISVGFTSTTFPPIHIRAIAMADSDSESESESFSTVTADGLIFSIGSTAAAIAGTTYRIDPASSPRTAVVDGHAVSIGQSGVAIAGTTVNPVTMSFPTATTPPPEMVDGSPFGSGVTTGAAVRGRHLGLGQLMMSLLVVVVLGLCVMI